jgi:hypothetical protein
MPMKDLTFALAAAGLVAAALPFQARAHCHDCGIATGVSAGAAGAIIGSALAAPPIYADPPAYDEMPPDYGPPPPGRPDSPDYVDPASCHFERQQVWDGTRYRLQRIEICE